MLRLLRRGSSGWQDRALVLIGLLAAAACARTVAVNSPVAKGQARYIVGTSTAGLSVAPGPLSGLNVSGRILTTSSSDFVLDAGRHGILRIPYASIADLIYGPQFYPVDRDKARAGESYPWSSGIHRANYYYLKIRFQDGGGVPRDVVLGLAEDIERPTLELLERRSGRSIDFETVEACLRTHAPDACAPPIFQTAQAELSDNCHAVSERPLITLKACLWVHPHVKT